MNRRQIIKALAGIGVGSAVFGRAVAALAQDELEITAAMIKEAEWIAGIELTEEQREEAAKSLQYTHRELQRLRDVKLTNDVGPAVHFRTLAPTTSTTPPVERKVRVLNAEIGSRPATDEAVAFLPVSKLATLIRNRQITSLELTRIYLARIKKYNPLLNCVVNLTEDLAIRQARRADEEIAAGKYRGPLHGIPWGAKDLISVPGYPTTWGAPQYREQMLETTATVTQRLEEAGAVLIAKLTMGALAMGDKWFGGMTRSPWNYELGSSGSSAGSASAVVAGLCGFTLGTETLGSIISPSRRCGATGLRPTFGRVSRAGCMALSWSMDKIGPITRSVEDCALVLAAIHGADGQDPTAQTEPYQWPAEIDLTSLTVGFTPGRRPIEEREDLNKLKELGVQLQQVELPSQLPERAVTTVLDIEAAAAFDELTRSGNVEGLNAWPGIFRRSAFVSGVDYVRAMRVRTLLQREFEKLMSQVDVLVNTNDLVQTNLTGHPSISLPVSFRERNGMKQPVSTVFTGRLFEESKLLALADAYQNLHDAHLQQPPLDAQLEQQAKALEAEREAAEKAAEEQERSKSSGQQAGSAKSSSDDGTPNQGKRR